MNWHHCFQMQTVYNASFFAHAFHRELGSSLALGVLCAKVHWPEQAETLLNFSAESLATLETERRDAFFDEAVAQFSPKNGNDIPRLPAFEPSEDRVKTMRNILRRSVQPLLVKTRALLSVLHNGTQVKLFQCTDVVFQTMGPFSRVVIASQLPLIAVQSSDTTTDDLNAEDLFTAYIHASFAKQEDDSTPPEGNKRAIMFRSSVVPMRERLFSFSDADRDHTSMFTTILRAIGINHHDIGIVFAKADDTYFLPVYPRGYNNVYGVSRRIVVESQRNTNDDEKSSESVPSSSTIPYFWENPRDPHISRAFGTLVSDAVSDVYDHIRNSGNLSKC